MTQQKQLNADDGGVACVTFASTRADAIKKIDEGAGNVRTATIVLILKHEGVKCGVKCEV